MTDKEKQELEARRKESALKPCTILGTFPFGMRQLLSFLSIFTGP